MKISKQHTHTNLGGTKVYAVYQQQNIDSLSLPDVQGSSLFVKPDSNFGEIESWIIFPLCN